MTDIGPQRHGWWRRRGSCQVLGFAFATLLASGCGQQPAGPTAQPAGRPAGATLAVAGTLFNGNDPEQIRAYLQTVKEIKPIKFDVQWSPATVAVSKDAAIRSLLGVSRDGSTFRFARAEPVVARIKPGSILWIYDLAVAHVDSVDTRGDLVVVHTSPASLTQMFTRADIQFDAAPNLQNLYVAFRPHKNPAPTAVAAPTAMVSPQAPRLLPAVWRSGTRPALLRVVDEPPPESSAPPGQDDDADGDYGETQAVGDAKTGKLMGYEYSLGYSTSPDGASLELEARKEDEGGADPFPEMREDDEHEAQDAQADLQKQLDELAELKGKQLTAQTQLHDLESEYNREMTKLDSSMPDPMDRARAKQAETQQYHFRQNALQNQITALDKVRDTVSKIKAEDEERLKKLGEAGKLVEKLFDVVSDNLDVRFRVKADVGNFSVAGAFKVSDGKMDSAAAQFKDLKGRIHLDYVARMGKAGNGVVKVPVVGLPFVFNIPFPVAGFPLVIQLGSDFSSTIFLAGMHATQQFSGDYEFSGSNGFTATKSGAQNQTDISGEKPRISTAEAQSPGVSGVVLAVQMPRVGMGVGVFGASSVAYVDVVNVITMTNGASVSTGMMFAPLCTRTTYSAVGSVGIDSHIIPLPIPFVDKLDKALSTRKQVFEYHREILDPPVKGCEV